MKNRDRASVVLCPVGWQSWNLLSQNKRDILITEGDLESNMYLSSASWDELSCSALVLVNSLFVDESPGWAALSRV